MKIRKIILIIFGTIILALIYLNSEYYIKHQQWKYAQGESLGDWIEFDDKVYSLKYKTVFKNDVAVGKILFCSKEQLYVENFLSGKTGYYSNKGKR